MACPDVEMVQAFVGGSLVDAQRSGVEEHARSCPTCRELIAALADRAAAGAR